MARSVFELYCARSSRHLEVGLAGIIYKDKVAVGLVVVVVKLVYTRGNVLVSLHQLREV